LKNFIITGCSGFIGYSLSLLLLSKGHNVVGIDCFTDYYSIVLKNSRTKELIKNKNFLFIKSDLKNILFIKSKLTLKKIDFVIHLAAQPGVNYSFENPESYLLNINNNFHIYELMKQFKIKRIIYASSSSVYSGLNKIKFSEKDKISDFINFYGLTKYTNELFDKYFSKLYMIKSVGLRFFTVYGPYGRPDMAYFGFVDSILKNKNIKLYNKGENKRDFTYIDDVTDGIYKLINSFDKIRKLQPIYNIGNNNPRSVNELVQIIEKYLNKKAKISYLGKLKGDMTSTYADTKLALRDFNYSPSVDLEEGINNFIKWYLNYKKIKR